MYCHFHTFSYEGFTPLSRASRVGKEEIVSFLLSIKGLSPNKSDEEKVYNYITCITDALYFIHRQSGNFHCQDIFMTALY